MNQAIIPNTIFNQTEAGFDAFSTNPASLFLFIKQLSVGKIVIAPFAYNLTKHGVALGHQALKLNIV